MPAYHAVFYGGRDCEEAAIMGAIACASKGKQVGLISGNGHVGGMTAGGLTAQDRGKPARRVRGLYLEFVRRLGYSFGGGASYNARPSVAERVFLQMIAIAGRGVGGRVHLWLNQPLASVQKSGSTITSITSTNGIVFTAPNFIDCSRSLMLIQRAGAQGQLWTIGRESASAYGESLGGYGVVRSVRAGITTIPGTSTPLLGLSPDPGTAIGAADLGIQAPMFRSLISDDPNNRLKFDSSRIDFTTYNRNDHLLAAQLLVTSGSIRGFGLSPGISACNGDLLLTDDAGAPLHWTYDLKSDAEQIAIEAKYKRNFQHFNYFVMTDPSLEGTAIQASYREWGWPRDEFLPDGFPWAFYRRSGVRFIGNYMMSQQDLQVTDTAAPRNVFKTDAVAIGGYDIDHHVYQAHRNGSDPNSWVLEGGAQAPDKVNYDQGYCIPWRSLINDAVPNLASGWPSCTNAAAGSVRIIVNLCLASIACGYAAARAHTAGIAINAVPVADIQADLIADKYRTTVGPWVIDDEDDDDGDGVPDEDTTS